MASMEWISGNDDPRFSTVETRLAVGYLEDTAARWGEAEASFSPGCLKILGHPVMEDWETPYMRDLAGIAASQGGRVLELGFGLGISASFLQEFDVEEHVVVEANAQVFLRLQEFAAGAKSRVTPRLGLWETVVPSFESASFDGILFDTYPLTAEEIHGNHFGFFEEAHRLLKPGGIFTYYSDEIDHLNEVHVRRLREAGFTQIDYRVCPVVPPSDCEYWQHDTIVSPIITK